MGIVIPTFLSELHHILHYIYTHSVPRSGSQVSVFDPIKRYITSSTCILDVVIKLGIVEDQITRMWVYEIPKILKST